MEAGSENPSLVSTAVVQPYEYRSFVQGKVLVALASQLGCLYIPSPGSLLRAVYLGSVQGSPLFQGFRT